MPASHSEQRASRIREMFRDLNPSGERKGQSSNGDASSTTSGFDPENEAAMSTRQMDSFSPALPDRRASPSKHPRHRQPQLDYAINTSAIGRAFPEFTQSTGLDEEDSLSIEMGRGGKERDLRDYSPSLQGGGIDVFPAPGKPAIQSSPPRAALHEKAEQQAGGMSGSIRRDAQIRRASAAHLRDQGNVAKRNEHATARKQSHDKQRQSLGELHARVARDYDASQISDERPPTLNLTKKSTRFVNAQAGGNGLPSKFTSSKDLANALDNGLAKLQDSKNRPRNATVTSTSGMDNSFMLPDLPNLSELVSGVFQDGSPVFSRTAKPKASRFTVASRPGGRANPSHAALSAIPIPEDEQAIFVSLKLLQDKVADLEQDKAEAEAMVHELEARNQSLEQEKIEQRRLGRRDSALGSTDGSEEGADASKGARSLYIEKSRLESTVRALQEQVNKAARKSSVAEITIGNLTRERDAAVSQLGVAYLTTEQLKRENQALRQGIEDFKALWVQPAPATQHEGEPARNRHSQPSASYTGGKERAIPVEEELPVGTRAAAQKTRLPSSAAPDIHDKRKGRTLRSQVAAESKTNVDARRGRQPRQGFEDGFDGEESKAADPRRVRETNGGTSGWNRRNDEVTGEITYLSFTNNQDIAELRRALEIDRVTRKDGKATTNGPLVDEATRTGHSGRDAPMRRKSSMKNQSGKLNGRDEAEQVENTAQARSAKASMGDPRQFEESILEHEIRRGDMRADDLTSAFIIPDITMRNAALTQEPLKLSASAQRVFDNQVRHDGHNCTVCKQYINRGSDHTHEAHESSGIPKPVPVSERMPGPDAYEEEPTQRPAQSPGIALATVLKGLEDELAHLKIKASQYQALYNKQDPSLGKRKRKSVLLKIETTLKAVDVKADQIYALYDVLEGQKATGLAISDEQVEVTLQSIGIDLASIGLRGGGVPENDKENTTKVSQLSSSAWEDGSSNSDNDLPWEGIESTADLTGPSIFAGRRNSWTT